MAAPIKPALKRAFGNDAWTFVPAIANTSAPTVAEVTAATGFNLSCSLFGEQEGISTEVAKVTLPRILGETDTFEVNGETTHSMADLMVSFDPQAAAGADGKKAWEAMSDGESGFLVRRQGVTATTDFAAGQFVDVVPVTLGTKVPTKTGTGADGVYAFTVGASITSAPKYNVAVAV